MSTISLHLEKNINRRLTLLLFDLDGTLLDSSNGIFAAIKYAFISQRLSVDFDASTLRQYAGRGIEFLLKKINNQLTSAQLTELKQVAFGYYQIHAADMTHAFSSIDDLMKALQTHRILWGIVTSKTRVLTEAVLSKVPRYNSASIVVCADDLNYKKPHPMPLIYAIKMLNVLPKNCAYVGDTKTDMLAAKHAHCYRIFADYGYEAEHINKDYYDLKISNLEQLRQWIICTHA